MKFGKVVDPSKLNLKLPNDHPETLRVLNANPLIDKKPRVNIGWPKWAKKDFGGFYPKGVKDDLSYYSTQYNSIELNAFYYRIFPASTVQKWVDRTRPNFKFFPKVPQLISQFRRLKNCEDELNDFFVSISHFEEKLGTVFLQMNENYSPQNFEDFKSFIKNWPKNLPLSVELRHPDWFSDENIAIKLYGLLQQNGVSNTITDTAGRRDIIHMRLTNPTCFVRFTGANHSSDIDRIDEWFERLSLWKDLGIHEINFFIHQTIEKDLQLLSTYLIQKINENWGYNLHVPQKANAASLI